MCKKVVVVTAGSSAMGSLISLAFAKKDFTVIFTYNSNEEKALECLNSLKVFSSDSIMYKLNVASENEVIGFFKFIEQKFNRVDVLINNAGINIDASISKMTMEQWQTVITTNLTSAFLCSKYALTIMIKNNFGRIISIGSVTANTGGFGIANYSASKSGLIGLTKSIALEYATKNITANIVSLGYMDTGMAVKIKEELLLKIVEKIPMKKLANSERVANFIVDLISENSEYITGQSIEINGGLY